MECDLQYYMHEFASVKVSGQAASKLFTIPRRRTYVILHLFSGRRRHNDINAHLDYITAFDDFDIIALSLDLATARKEG